MLAIPAPSYSLAQAAWIPRITTWRDDGIMQRREGAPCESWVEAMAAELATRVPAQNQPDWNRLPTRYSGCFTLSQESVRPPM